MTRSSNIYERTAWGRWPGSKVEGVGRYAVLCRRGNEVVVKLFETHMQRAVAYTQQCDIFCELNHSGVILELYPPVRKLDYNPADQEQDK